VLAVVAVDGLDQAHATDLSQVVDRLAPMGVALCQPPDEPEMALDQLLPSAHVADLVVAPDQLIVVRRAVEQAEARACLDRHRGYAVVAASRRARFQLPNAANTSPSPGSLLSADARCW
jgi:hypothetical protein